MKRYGNIYQKIYDLDNLRLAHRNARKDKSFYKDVKMVDENEDFYLLQIQDMLINKTYKVSPYATSTIVDKGKERILCKLPYFPDRIIQWAILLQTKNIFTSTLTDFTCASLENRGIHKASKILTNYLIYKKNTRYCLKLDVRKFYPSINHNILKSLIVKKIKDKDLLDLLYKIVDSVEGDIGIPIGSYLSQFFANFYLTYFDHWLKEDKKCKYVVRYMDDIVILHNKKEFLHSLIREIQEYLSFHLNLDVKSNWQVFPTAIRGIDFVGYRHFYGYKLLRKTTAKRYKKQMLNIRKKMENKENITYSEWCSVNSYKGWLNWGDCYRLSNKYYLPIKQYVDNYYFTKIKKEVLI